MTGNLTQTQQHALTVLRAAGGVLDYNRDVFGFAKHDTSYEDRVRMVTAKALIKRGLVVVTRRTLTGRHEVIDQITLVVAHADS